MRLTQFGLGSQVYVFPDESEVEAQDNFREVMDTGKAVIGKSGFIDQFGNGAAPTKDGEVRVTLWLHGNDPADMATKINAVGAMTEWGYKPLYRMVDGQGLQYCRARLMNAAEIYKYADRPEKRMRIPLKFDVADPWWLKKGSAIWGEAVWGAFTWGGSSYSSVNASGKSTSTTITNNGNLTIPVLIQVECSAIQTCQYPTIQRIKTGAVVEEVRWYDTLAASKRLYIDAGKQRVTQIGVAAYDKLTWKTADWLTLEPGSNTIKILFENSTDAATVKFHYQEAYR